MVECAKCGGYFPEQVMLSLALATKSAAVLDKLATAAGYLPSCTVCACGTSPRIRFSEEESKERETKKTNANE